MRWIFWKGFINSVLFVGGNGQATSTSDRWMTRELQITSDQTASINTKDSAVCWDFLIKSYPHGLMALKV